ncbi:MAG: TatD family hydrolase [Candidatus Pacearchaeota archaeon]
MIDSHCHLEQKEFENKLDFFIPKWREELSFIVSSCAHPDDIEKTLEIYRKFKPFVRICIGFHPEFVEAKEKEIEKVVEFISEHKKEIVAIGEVGLDYWEIKNESSQEKQKQLFSKFIKLAKKLALPLVVHSREASKDCVELLEQHEMQGKRVLMHLFQSRELLKRIEGNGWFISIGPGILKSKNAKKIAKAMPIQHILLETDSPWFAQPGQDFGIPLNVKIVCEKIAEIKKIPLAEVEKQTDENAIEFFNLEK